MENPVENKMVTVLGIGGAGCRVLHGFVGSPAAASLRLLAVDTDRRGLEGLNLPEGSTLLAGARWRGGRGCGGNVLDGQRALAHERAALERMLAGTSMLLVVGGLGGGTASGGVSVVLSVARKLEIPTLFLVTLPFTLEGHSKRKTAEETVKNELLGLADAVLCLPNDLLFSILDSTTPLSEAFRLADREFSRTVLALTAVLRHGNLLAADFNNFVALLKRKKSYCSIGVGLVESTEVNGRIEAAMEQLLHSPLLGGADKLGEADAVVFSLLGGPELSIGETKAALELAGRYVKPGAELIIGASTGEEWSGMLQLTAVTIRFDAETVTVEAMRKETSRMPRRGRAAAGAADGASTQLELFPLLEPLSKGIMEKTMPVLWNGEDLDIPTFKRRNAAVDNGKLVGE